MLSALYTGGWFGPHPREVLAFRFDPIWPGGSAMKTIVRKKKASIKKRKKAAKK